jgi:hypothetical protein
MFEQLQKDERSESENEVDDPSSEEEEKEASNNKHRSTVANGNASEHHTRSRLTQAAHWNPPSS